MSGDFSRTSVAPDQVRLSFSRYSSGPPDPDFQDLHDGANATALGQDSEVTTGLLPPAATSPRPATTATTQSQSKLQELTDAFVIGMINTVASVPCNLAYVTIMFPSKRFAAFMCPLARLAFLSSAIHQVTMSFRSSLPFAIGQVQDVGLIFLSAMSTSVASLVIAGPGADEAEQDKADQVMVTTTLVAMSLATCLTGLLLMLVGWYALLLTYSYCMSSLV